MNAVFSNVKLHVHHAHVSHNACATLPPTITPTHLADGCSSSRRLLVADGMAAPTALLMESDLEHLEGWSMSSKFGVVGFCISVIEF